MRFFPSYVIPQVIVGRKYRIMNLIISIYAWLVFWSNRLTQNATRTIFERISVIINITKSIIIWKLFISNSVIVLSLEIFLFRLINVLIGFFDSKPNFWTIFFNIPFASTWSFVFWFQIICNPKYQLIGSISIILNAEKIPVWPKLCNSNFSELKNQYHWPKELWSVFQIFYRKRTFHCLHVIE